MIIHIKPDHNCNSAPDYEYEWSFLPFANIKAKEGAHVSVCVLQNRKPYIACA